MVQINGNRADILVLGILSTIQALFGLLGGILKNRCLLIFVFLLILMRFQSMLYFQYYYS